MGVEDKCEHNFILMDNLGELYIACSKCWKRYDGRKDIELWDIKAEVDL